MSPRARAPSLGTVERHKVERWLAQKLRSSLYIARSTDADHYKSARIEVAWELSELLCDFQHRDGI